jgi:hypothetical protein
MKQQTQAVQRSRQKRDRLATFGCNPPCDHDGMVEYDKDRMSAALAELDALTAAFEASRNAHEGDRKALQEAIVRHLRDLNAPPGEVAKHVPYDRNHVRRIADEAGVPALRTSTVRPAKAKRKGA